MFFLMLLMSSALLLVFARLWYMAGTGRRRFVRRAGLLLLLVQVGSGCALQLSAASSDDGACQALCPDDAEERDCPPTCPPNCHACACGTPLARLTSPATLVLRNPQPFPLISPPEPDLVVFAQLAHEIFRPPIL